MEQRVPVAIQPAGGIEWRVDLAMAGYQGWHRWQGIACDATEAVTIARRELVHAMNAYLNDNGMIDVQILSVLPVPT